MLHACAHLISLRSLTPHKQSVSSPTPVYPPRNPLDAFMTAVSTAHLRAVIQATDTSWHTRHHHIIHAHHMNPRYVISFSLPLHPIYTPSPCMTIRDVGLHSHWSARPSYLCRITFGDSCLPSIQYLRHPKIFDSTLASATHGPHVTCLALCITTLPLSGFAKVARATAGSQCSPLNTSQLA